MKRNSEASEAILAAIMHLQLALGGPFKRYHADNAKKQQYAALLDVPCRRSTTIITSFPNSSQ